VDHTHSLVVVVLVFSCACNPEPDGVIERMQLTTNDAVNTADLTERSD